jgi:hypothetical protein
MKILALDLGKFKSVACVLDTVTGRHVFVDLPRKPVPGVMRVC